LIDNTNDGD